MRVDDVPLPLVEGDDTLMFLPRAVLREQTGPVTAVAGHHDAPLLAHQADAVGGLRTRNGRPAGIDEPRPGVRTGDPQHITPARVRADTAVTQVQPEQVGVRGGIGGGCGALAHRTHSVEGRESGSILVRHARIAERDTPVSLLTELRLRPWARSARACSRVAMSYTAGAAFRGRDQYLGPMWASMRATEGRLATEMLKGSSNFRTIFHSTPTDVSASEQMPRMSGDLLVKK